MKSIFLRNGMILALLTNILVGAVSQQSVRLLATESRITITGTSTLHDWEETVGKFDVAMILKLEKNEIMGIDHVHFNCKSESIVSDNSLMTSKTLDALKADQYPEIVFTMVSMDNLTSENGRFSGTLSGNLNLAGVAKHIVVPFSGSFVNNRIKISASKKIKLTDFKIKPPTAVMGTLKTGEEVVVSFQLQFIVN
jgi:hypothetical protein